MQTQSERMYDFDDFYFDVSTFNEVAGKDKATTKQQLLDQIKLIQEELNELRQGVEEDNPVEILDGAADVAVTLFGLVQQLKNLEFDFHAAALVTAQNNLTKFVYDESVAQNTVEVLSVAEPTRKFRFVRDKLSGLYAVLDDANKVRKPVGYVKNNVSKYVPADYKEKISAN